MSKNWQKRYTRAILPLLSKIINLKIERGDFKADQYEGMLDNLNRYIVLSLDDSAIKFDKPVPRLSCDCHDCRQKIRAIKGRMSDAFFHKEGKSSFLDNSKSSKVSVQSYLLSKAMEKGSFKGGGLSDSNRRAKRENLNSAIRQQIDKTRREIIEDKMRYTKTII